jgi:putative redox protein
MLKISTHYDGNMRFRSGEDVSRVVMDANQLVGGLGEAPSPKKMVLHGLAGCTGMDVAAILKKKKVEYDNFFIEVEANETEAHPRVFKEISMVFRFTAAPEDRIHIERAIELSKGQFCGVSEMLGKTASIKWELEITPRS